MQTMYTNKYDESEQQQHNIQTYMEERKREMQFAAKRQIDVEHSI